MSQVDGAISGVWEFSTDLFDVSRMERMLGHYEALLRAIVEVPEEAIGRLSLLSDAERRQLDTWSGGASAYPRDAGLASLFAEQVATAPQAEALRFGDVSMSYAELDAASSRLAAYLDACFAPEPGTVIGLCVERGPQLVVALLGIIKAGCAYPLDPDYPSERVRFMLDDAGATVLLSESSVLPAVPVGLVKTVLLDEQGEEIAGCEAPVPAATRANGSSLAYVMYTSGSTGQPKGVLIPQRAVTRLVRTPTMWTLVPAHALATCRTLPLMRRRSSSGARC